MEEMEETKSNAVIKRNRSFNNSRLNHRYGKNLSFGGTSDTLMSDASSFGHQQSSSNDLDWDKSNDFRRMVESDQMSVYDLNEQMAELIRLKLLEFEAISASCSVKSFQQMMPLASNRKGSFDDDQFETDNELDSTIEQLDLETNGGGKEPSQRKRSRLYSKRMRNLTNSSITSNGEFTPADGQGLTMEDLFKCKLLSLEQDLKASLSALNVNATANNNLYTPITFDLESLYASMDPNPVLLATNTNAVEATSNLNFYHSMPDLRVFTSSEMRVSLECCCATKSIQLGSKHGSLMDMRSFEWIYIKRTSVNRANLIKSLKLDLKSSYSNGFPSIPLNTTTTVVEHTSETVGSGAEKEAVTTPSSTSQAGMAINFSRMSKLTMLRSYMARLGEKVKQILAEVFSNANFIEVPNNSGSASHSSNVVPAYAFNAKTSNLYSINEETVDTYDIIENPLNSTTTAKTAAIESVVSKLDKLILERQDSSEA